MTEAQLLALFEEFKQEHYPNQWSDQPGELRHVAVVDLTHPDTAAGECYEVSEYFVAWLDGRGVTSRLVETENVAEWGMQGVNRYGIPSDYANHAAVAVNFDAGTMLVDWTAAQFPGESDFPRVTYHTPATFRKAFANA